MHGHGTGCFSTWNSRRTAAHTRGSASPLQNHTFLSVSTTPPRAGTQLAWAFHSRRAAPPIAAGPTRPGSCSPELGGGHLYLKALDLPNYPCSSPGANEQSPAQVGSRAGSHLRASPASLLTGELIKPARTGAPKLERGLQTN